MARADQPATPLEHVAPIYVDVSGDYIDIRQAHGDYTLYTPEEARELAHELLEAADAAEE